MNKLAGTRGSADTFAQVIWLVLRRCDTALLNVCLALGLEDCRHLDPSTCVTPQWCFLQAIWASNLQVAKMLRSVCGKEIDVNHRYRWDVIPSWHRCVGGNVMEMKSEIDHG